MRTQNDYEATIQTICRLAKAGDKPALKQLMASGICIGVFNNNRNAVMLLAKEGHEEAVWFLLNTFGASLNHAVYGAAWGGRVAFALQLIDAGASKDLGVEGAALGDHFEFTQQLLADGASIVHALQGAAQGGHMDRINHLVVYAEYLSYQQLINEHKQKMVLINDIFDTYYREEDISAVMDQDEKHDVIVKSINAMHHNISIDINSFETIWLLIQRGFLNTLMKLAMNGKLNINDTAELLAEHGHNDLTVTLLNKGANVHQVVLGAARRGDVVFVNQLIALGASYRQAMLAAASAGHFDLTQALFEAGGNAEYAASISVLFRVDPANKLFLSFIGTNINFLAAGAARGGHVKLANELLDAGASLQVVTHAELLSGHYRAPKEGYNQGNDANYLAEVAAENGDAELVNALLDGSEDASSALRIMSRAALGGHIDLVNQLLIRTKSRMYEAPLYDIPRDFIGSLNIASEASLLRLVSFVDDAVLRNAVVDFVEAEAIKNAVHIKGNVCRAKASKLNALMKKHDLDYHQAEAWLTPYPHILFLQLFPTLIKRLPFDAMLVITSFITPFAQTSSYQNTLSLFKKHQAVLPPLLLALVKDEARTTAEERFTKRTTFYQ